MFEKSVRKALAISAIAALIVGATSADAVIYSSEFDPPNFSGVATFDVAQACLNAGPGFVANGSPGCTISWLTAMVTLNETGFTSRTFTFEPFFLPNAGAVNSIFVQGGELRGVDTNIIGPRILFGDLNPNFNGPFWLEYDFSLDGASGEFGLGVVNLYNGNCDGEFCGRNPVPSRADVENFRRVTTIGEPASAALALAGLCAAWLLRRRPRSAD